MGKIRSWVGRGSGIVHRSIFVVVVDVVIPILLSRDTIDEDGDWPIISTARGAPQNEPAGPQQSATSSYASEAQQQHAEIDVPSRNPFLALYKDPYAAPPLIPTMLSSPAMQSLDSIAPSTSRRDQRAARRRISKHSGSVKSHTLRHHASASQSHESHVLVVCVTCGVTNDMVAHNRHTIKLYSEKDASVLQQGSDLCDICRGPVSAQLTESEKRRPKYQCHECQRIFHRSGQPTFTAVVVF